MNDIVTSIHGNLVGLDARQRLVVRHGIADQAINASGYGVIADGVRDNTVQMQAAIDAAVAANGVLRLPEGEILTGPLTIGAAGSYNTCAIVGIDFDGHFTTTTSRRTVIKLKNGSNGSLFTVPASDISDVGPGPVKFENVWLKGNRSNQTGTSYAVNFESHSLTANKQRAGFFRRVRIEEFRSAGIRAGTLRNAGVLEQVVILSIGAASLGSALQYGSIADWRHSDCDFGVTVGPVLQDSGAGSCFFMNCNFFNGGTHGMKLDTATADHYFINCSIDRNERYGVYIDPAGEAFVSFTNCKFTINSQETAATYSDVYCNNNSNVVFTACSFEKAGVTNFPLYHVETAGTTNGVLLVGCKFEATAAGAITNDFADIRLFGSDVVLLPNGTAAVPSYAFGTDVDTGMYRTSGGSIGFAVNGTAQFVVSDTPSSTRQIIAKGGTNDTTAGPSLSTTGGTNVDLRLVPAGTGVVSFGDYTVGAAADSTGYITIKDEAGNTRKLMVQA